MSESGRDFSRGSQEKEQGNVCRTKGGIWETSEGGGKGKGVERALGFSSCYRQFEHVGSGFSKDKE